MEMFDERPRPLSLDDLYAEKGKSDISNSKISDFKKQKKRGRKKAAPETKAKHVDITLYPTVIGDIDKVIAELQKKGIIMTRSRLLTLGFYKLKDDGIDKIRQF